MEHFPAKSGICFARRGTKIVSAKLELARRAHDEPTPDEAWMSFDSESAQSTSAAPVTPANPNAPSANPNAPSPPQTTALQKRPAVEGNLLAAVPAPPDSLDSLTAR